MTLSADTNLTSKTLRTIAVLVGSCVLFVGVLSVAAVVITNKAMGASQHDRQATQQPASPTSPQSI